jgi:hypothetical protein
MSDSNLDFVLTRAAIKFLEEQMGTVNDAIRDYAAMHSETTKDNLVIVTTQDIEDSLTELFDWDKMIDSFSDGLSDFCEKHSKEEDNG